jgi:hypothetical protein
MSNFDLEVVAVTENNSCVERFLDIVTNYGCRRFLHDIADYRCRRFFYTRAFVMILAVTVNSSSGQIIRSLLDAVANYSYRGFFYTWILDIIVAVAN